MCIVEDNEALHACALDQQVTLGAWTVGPGIPTRDRSRSANDHPCADGKMAQNYITDRTTGVVEIEIDTFGAGGSEGGFDIVALVVDGRIIPEQFAALGDLGWSAGY